jgi:hypothetical protein
MLCFNLNYRMTAREIEEKLQSAKLKVEQDYDKFMKFPSTHPLYSQEWKIFYKKKYMEIKAGGTVDPEKYDYVPDWYNYWKARLNELKILEIKEQQKKIEEKYVHVKCERGREKSDEQRKRHRSKSSETGDREAKKRQTTPPSRSRRDDDSPVDLEEVTFVSVCRLLPTVEKFIGPLAPHCLKLLMRAISVERSCPTQCNEIMMTAENAVLLETVQQKLIGLIELDLVPSGLRKAIPTILKRIKKLTENYQVPKSRQEIKKKWTDIIRSLKNSADGEIQLDILVEVLGTEIAEEERDESSDEVFDSKEKKELSDEDLIFLLMNVKNINSDEKDHLITYMAKMKISNPERVKFLFEVSRQSMMSDD